MRIILSEVVFLVCWFGPLPCHRWFIYKVGTLNLPMTYVREDWHLMALHEAFAWSLNCLFFSFGCSGVHQVAHDQGLLQEVSGQVQAQARLVIVSCRCLWMWKQMLKDWRTCLLVPLDVVPWFVCVCWHIFSYGQCAAGKTDDRARIRLTTQDKNKYNTPKYRYVVRFVSSVQTLDGVVKQWCSSL